MYEIFDDYFRNVRGWHQPHILEEKRFFRILKQVIEDPAFDPEQLGAYMDGRRNGGVAGYATLSQSTYEDARRFYVRSAHAVRNFLTADEN